MVGGQLASNGQVTNDVEITNPINGSSVCTKPPNFPMPTWQSLGGFVLDRIVACGGYGASTDTDSCYLHNPTGQSCQMV